MLEDPLQMPSLCGQKCGFCAECGPKPGRSPALSLCFPPLGNGYNPKSYFLGLCGGWGRIPGDDDLKCLAYSRCLKGIRCRCHYYYHSAQSPPNSPAHKGQLPVTFPRRRTACSAGNSGEEDTGVAFPSTYHVPGTCSGFDTHDVICTHSYPHRYVLLSSSSP